MTSKLLLAAGFTGVLFGAPALAAEIPVKARPVPAPIAYSWTGLYVGGHVGYGGGMKDWTNAQFNYVAKGFLGGGQIGVNQQIGNWVIGIEADASWADITGSQTFVLGGPALNVFATGTGATRIDRLLTVAGRLGFAQDRWLVYAKLGAAWAHETHTLTASQTPFVAGVPGVAATAASSASEDRFGPVLGFGAEYAFLGNWSAKLEYNFLPFRTGTVRFAGTTTAAGVTTPFIESVNIPQSLHLFKFGVNYRFDTPGMATAIAPSPPAAGFNWTGVYVGAQGGYAAGRKNFIDLDPVGQFNVDGWIAGATVGANAQAGVFVPGVELEWMWTGVKGTGASTLTILGGLATATTELSSKIEWLAMASARMGFVAADRWLVYGKGGVAFAQEKHTQFQATVSPLGNVTVATNGEGWHTGYVVGAGVEYALLGGWSAKFEYDFIGFRQQPIIGGGTLVLDIPGNVGTGPFLVRNEIRQSMHLVKFGINYHFGSAPDAIRARY
jgi:outer membrane immunogenic protein